MAGYCDNFSMIDGDSSNFSMIDGGDEFKAFPGLKGEDGTTFYPHVSAEGVLSWTNDGGKPNPDPVNIKGADGKSAYQAAVEAGFSGTEAEFNTYLSGIGNLTDLVDRKAGALVDTASGAIASFVPDSTIPDLLGVTVAVEPVQDLHGQASPWHAGGGLNKYPESAISGTNNGVTVTQSGGSYALSGTATAYSQFISSEAFTLPAGEYTLKQFSWVSGIYVQLRSVDGQTTFASLSASDYAAFTLASETTIKARIVVNANVVTNRTIQIEIVSGSTAPTAYFPYSNLCPISGWSEVGIEAAGQNLFDSVYSYHSASALTPVKAGQTYTISTKHVAGGEGLNICFYDGAAYSNDQSVIQTGSSATTAHLTFTVPAGKTHVNVYTVVTGSNTNNALFDTQIQPGSAVSPYEEYHTPTTYTIQLGQTVYGGTLDVTNGTMTVDRKFEPLNNLTSYNGGEVSWRFDSDNNVFSTNVQIVPAGTAGAETGILSSCYAARAYGYNASYATETSVIWAHTNGSLRVRDARFTDVNSWLADVGNQTVCYPLATPITISLDPVTIATISGQTNNVWSDAGDVDVTYAADLKAYIDRLNQPTEDDMIANNLIAANKYFTINNRLFLSTASIAAGAQIIPGHNCTETSLVEALNALNA